MLLCPPNISGNPYGIFILAVIIPFIHSLLGQFVARGIVIINRTIVRVQSAGQPADSVIGIASYSTQRVGLAEQHTPFVISERGGGANLIRKASHPAYAVIGIGNGRMAAGGER